MGFFIGVIRKIRRVEKKPYHFSTHSPPQVIWCSSCLAAKGHASTHSPCCCHHTFNPKSSTNCSPKGFAALHAVLPFALAASFVTAALVSCIPLRSVVILYTSLCYIRYPSLMLVTFGLYARFIFSPLTGEIKRGLAHNHKLHSLPTRSSFHSIPFRSFLIHSASCSPPAAIVVLACACRPGFGLSCFLQPRFVGQYTSVSFQQPTAQSKNHASPCSCGHRSTHSTFRGLLIVRTALRFVPQLRAPCSHPSSSSRTLFVEATSFALEARNT